MKHQQPSAFTVIELLVVMSILVMLVLLVLPPLSESRDVAKQAMCAHNQHQLRIAMTGNLETDGSGALPAPARWIEYVTNKDAEEALVCPMDEAPASTGDLLDGLYILQDREAKRRGDGNGYVYTPIRTLYEGKPISDGQIKTWLNGSQPYGSVNWWAGGRDGQAPFRRLGFSDPEGPMGDKLFVALEKDAAVGFYFDVAEPYAEAHPGWSHSASRHFVGKAPSDDAIGGVSPSDPTWVTEDIFQLAGYDVGQHYIDPRTPQALLGGGSSSFGMNNQVNASRLTSEQILLLDYERTLVDVDGQGISDDDFAALYAGRHFGMANVLYVDGSVRVMSRAAIDPVDQTPWASR